jgi:hypothetical protein
MVAKNTLLQIDEVSDTKLFDSTNESWKWPEFFWKYVALLSLVGKNHLKEITIHSLQKRE